MAPGANNIFFVQLFESLTRIGKQKRIFMNNQTAGAPIGRDKWPIKYGDDARNPSFYNF